MDIEQQSEFVGILDCYNGIKQHADGLVQERCNSSALAMELHLSCTKPLKYRIGHLG